MRLKWTVATLLGLLAVFSLQGQQKTYQLSSHILDIHTGLPAPEVVISLSKLTPQGEWELLDEKTTDGNGRVKDFLEQDGSDHSGVYKLTYHVGPYFEKQGQNSFYPFIEVVFRISGSSHYHVPPSPSRRTGIPPTGAIKQGGGFEGFRKYPRTACGTNKTAGGQSW